MTIYWQLVVVLMPWCVLIQRSLLTNILCFLSAGEELQWSSVSQLSASCRLPAANERKPEHGQPQHGFSVTNQQVRQRTSHSQSAAGGKNLTV